MMAARRVVARRVAARRAAVCPGTAAAATAVGGMVWRRRSVKAVEARGVARGVSACGGYVAGVHAKPLGEDIPSVVE